MSRLRNPFRLRASERVERDEVFVQLFAPGAVQLLTSPDDWTLPRLIRSAPGGGKSSLFRLLTPSVLNAVFRMRHQESFAELVAGLEKASVLDAQGPRILGVMLRCGQDYATLHHLFPAPVAQRLFFALLDARICLQTVRAATVLADRGAGCDASELAFTRPADSPGTSRLPLPCDGATLLEWAVAQERRICAHVDRGVVELGAFPEGSDRLESLDSLTAASILFHGQPLAHRTLVLLDDLHSLAAGQRRLLLDELGNRRFPVTVWCAERLHAMEQQELLADGAREGRDFAPPLYLERFWIEQETDLRATLAQVADRRCQLSTVATVHDFEGCLDQQHSSEVMRLSLPRQQHVLSKMLEWCQQVRERSTREAALLAQLDAPLACSTLDDAIKLRAAIIKVSRERAKTQQEFSFAVVPMIDSEVKKAAALFLSVEMDLPYYFGFPTICQLSSCNFEQFLGLGAELFEEVAAVALGPARALTLSAGDQDRIIRSASDHLIAAIGHYVPNPEDVLALLNGVGHACRAATFREEAPYSPGVSVVAVREREWRTLSDNMLLRRNPLLRRLANTLEISLSHNLLTKRSRRTKGETWVLLSLNRLLCPYFLLPLQSGQFAPARATEMSGWIANGRNLKGIVRERVFT